MKGTCYYANTSYIYGTAHPTPAAPVPGWMVGNKITMGHSKTADTKIMCTKYLQGEDNGKFSNLQNCKDAKCYTPYNGYKNILPKNMLDCKNTTGVCPDNPNCVQDINDPDCYNVKSVCKVAVLNDGITCNTGLDGAFCGNDSDCCTKSCKIHEIGQGQYKWWCDSCP